MMILSANFVAHVRSQSGSREFCAGFSNCHWIVLGAISEMSCYPWLEMAISTMIGCLVERSEDRNNLESALYPAEQCSAPSLWTHSYLFPGWSAPGLVYQAPLLCHCALWLEPLYIEN